MRAATHSPQAAMLILVLGLVLFLGPHFVRVFAEPWRVGVRQRIGEKAWKGIYSVISIVGFVLICWGYSRARLEPTPLWATPTWTRHLAALLTLFAFILLAAAKGPGNWFRSRLRHPMTLGVKVWALAHLLANNTVADVVLFGSFLVWSVLVFRAARQRDRATGAVAEPSTARGTVAAVVIGIVVWAVFAFWAHGALIGVRPFGGA